MHVRKGAGYEKQEIIKYIGKKLNELQREKR